MKDNIRLALELVAALALIIFIGLYPFLLTRYG